MTDFLLCQIALPASDDIALSWVAEQSDDIFRADSMATLGNLDFFMPVRDRVHGHRTQGDDYWTVELAAVEGVDASRLRTGDAGLPELSWDAAESGEPGRVLAVGAVGGGLHQNLTVANVGLIVTESARRRGVGRAMAEVAESIARGRGRTVVQSWAEHLAPRDEADALVPPTGVGAISRTDAATQFALALGFTLEQCERHSVCPLPIDEVACAPLYEQAVAASSGYSVRTVVGPVPDDLAQPYCDLLTHFSTEAPSAGLESEEERWTVERLRRSESRRAATGRTGVLTLAIHDATGQVAAATELTDDANNPHVGFQQVTIVDAAHRGHRLGMLIKITNAREFHARFPQAERIHTWNAGENQWMLAINDAMGFRARIVEGAWQKKLA